MSDQKPCEHADMMRVVALPDAAEGCEECLKIGGTWVNLRMCLTCGKVGCCDDSPNTHARKHWQAIDHPIIQAVTPAGVDWKWCYEDEVMLG